MQKKLQPYLRGAFITIRSTHNLQSRAVCRGAVDMTARVKHRVGELVCDVIAKSLDVFDSVVVWTNTRNLCVNCHVTSRQLQLIDLFSPPVWFNKTRVKRL